MSAEGALPLPGLEHLAPSTPGSRSGGPQRPVDPTLAPGPAQIAAFWAATVTTPGCIYWVGAISSPDGYGRVNYARHHAQRTVSAHRFALELVHGLLPEDFVGAHNCDQPLCVRVHPDHLTLATQRDNVRHAIAVGHHRGPLALHPDGHTRYQRSLAVRAALADGYNPDRLAAAIGGNVSGQAALF